MLSKVPKEQHTCVDVPGEGVMDIKMRVFVTNSEDAKAVNDYIRIHEKQVRYKKNKKINGKDAKAVNDYIRIHEKQVRSIAV